MIVTFPFFDFLREEHVGTSVFSTAAPPIIISLSELFLLRLGGFS